MRRFDAHGAMKESHPLPIDRRRRLLTSSLLALTAAGSARAFALEFKRWVCSPPALPGAGQLINDIQKRAFAFFWETTNPVSGLVRDRWPSSAFASITAVGFGLTAYPIGVERGYVTRAQAGERVLATVRFFWNCVFRRS
jgi:hypothetical protein